VLLIHQRAGLASLVRRFFPRSLDSLLCFLRFFIFCIVLSVMGGYVLFPLSGYVLYALRRLSGHVSYRLSGYVLCSLIFFSGNILWPLNAGDHLIELLPQDLEVIGVPEAFPDNGNNAKAKKLSSGGLLLPLGESGLLAHFLL
jgi:hypothetical protein